MSILLDALRRSEEQRKLGKAPDIHASTGAGAAPRSSMQRLAPLMLIAVVAIALAWFGWRQFQAPQSEDVSENGTAPVAAESIASGSDAAVADPGSPAQPRSRDSAPLADASQRTPVEKLPAERGSAGADSAAAANDLEPRRARVNESFTTFEAAQQAGDESREPPVVAAATPPVSAPAPEQAESKAPDSPTEEVTAAARSTGAEPRTTEPISFWALPQGIRDSLPDLRITVLVYSERPQDRFVLVGGQRLVEKDRYQEGIVLEEIRREGAVFLYRNYRFLVEG
jgi:general secretion pathway protein B